MLFYTWESFSALIHTKRYQAAGIFQRQNAIIFVTYILGIVTIFMNQKDTTDVNVIILGGLQMCFLIVVLGIFPIIYPNINKGILSNMCMLLTIGFIILARLSFEKSVKQFIIVAVVTMLSLNTNFSDTWMQRLVPNIDPSKLIADVQAKYPLVEEMAGWPQRFPSVDLVNDYLVVDEDGKAKEWNQTSYYKKFLVDGGTVEDAIYKNRDKRFKASIVYDGCSYFANRVWLREGGNLYYTSKTTEFWGMPVSGYVYRKCVYEAKRLLNSEKTDYHYTLLRLGRSYLNYAEIKLRQGDKETAIDYINRTRVTHGGLPELQKSLSLEDTWKEYKRERRIELVSEGDRYWSVLRWGKADGLEVVPELIVEQKFMKIAPDGKSFEIIPIPIYQSDNERTFTKKHYLFPVPQGQRDLNPILISGTMKRYLLEIVTKQYL